MQKFHDHFYSGDNETKLTDLTSVRQGRDESIHEYFKKFKDIKNRCFNLSLSEKDLVDLALAGLHSSYRVLTLLSAPDLYTASARFV